MIGAMWREREWGLLWVILLLTAIVGVVDAGFLRFDNGRDILVRASPVAIVACGVMLVVLTGEIDISVGSLMALLAALLGVITSSDYGNWSATWGIVIVCFAGTFIGTLTGVLVTYGRVPSILATLGLLTAFRGLTTLVMRGQNIDDLPVGLTDAAKYGMAGVPAGIWVAASVIAATAVFLRYTTWGRQIYAVGSNPHAARILGLPVHRLRIATFAYTGFLTGLATLVEVPRLPEIEAGIGQGFELLVVTTVVVGGVSISGGRGKLRGVLLAALLLTMIRPALTFLDLGEAGEKWTKAVQGGMILLAVLADSTAPLTLPGSRGDERRPDGTASRGPCSGERQPHER